MLPFSGLGLDPRIADAMAALGFAEPTAVQRASIPLIAEGKDLYMQSETGTGKTLAYLAPAFSRALSQTGGGKPGATEAGKATPAADFSRGPALLVLSPTQPVLLQGAGGYSRKGPEPSQASYYYTLPHLEFFDVRDLIIHNWPLIPWGVVGLAALYGAVYTAFFLLATCLLYRRQRLA